MSAVVCALAAELQIRGDTEDNSEIILISQRKYMLSLSLMMGHKICFCGEIRLIITKSSQLPLLIWSTVIADHKCCSCACKTPLTGLMCLLVLWDQGFFKQTHHGVVAGIDLIQIECN